MKKILLVLSILLLHNCSKPKTVLICGDHICVNKDEAEQYFEKNLSIEVKILDIKKKDNVDLVQLNLENSSNNRRQVSVKKKSKTNKEVKTLSNEEIKEIKINLKKKKKNKKEIAKVIVINKSESNKALLKKEKKFVKKDKINTNEGSKVKSNEIVDICSIIEKCDIDEISKYLIGQGKKKDFPDITTRE